jgi:hypothetical protein
MDLPFTYKVDGSLEIVQVDNTAKVRRQEWRSTKKSGKVGKEMRRWGGERSAGVEED